MRVEGLAVAGREGGHPVRLGLALVLEERVEVAIDHFPQNTVHPEGASAIDPARVVEGEQLRDAPGTIRTCDLCLRRAALYPLSYGRPSGTSV